MKNPAKDSEKNPPPEGGGGGGDWRQTILEIARQLIEKDIDFEYTYSEISVKAKKARLSLADNKLVLEIYEVSEDEEPKTIELPPKVSISISLSQGHEEEEVEITITAPHSLVFSRS